MLGGSRVFLVTAHPAVVSDSLLAKAHVYCRIGDKNKAVEAYQAAYEKTGSFGLE